MNDLVAGRDGGMLPKTRCEPWRTPESLQPRCAANCAANLFEEHRLAGISSQRADGEHGFVPATYGYSTGLHAPA